MKVKVTIELDKDLVDKAQWAADIMDVDIGTVLGHLCETALQPSSIIGKGHKKAKATEPEKKAPKRKHKKRRYRTRACRFCGEKHTPQGITMHERFCADNPANK